MEIKLAENIKRMRKERSLTQEALANALGVTVGAVYKWEANLSSPEIGMLVRIADLFDTSVDTLLGYEMADKHKGAVTEHIYGLLQKKDRSVFEEAEKAIVRYPNDFGVIMAAGNVFSAFGIEEKNTDMMKRAISLFEKALGIVPYDVDPRYGKLSLIGNIALMYFLTGDNDKALSMMIENNEAGVFSSKIGWLTAMSGDSSENCYNRLTGSFTDLNFEMLNIASGLLLYYKNKGDLNRIKTLAGWCIEYVDSIRKTDEACFFDKIKCSYLTAESYAYFKSGDKEKAAEFLTEALELARFFDSSEEKTTDIIKLFDFQKEIASFSLLGETGMDSIESTLNMIDDKKFNALWNKINR
jgi:transcriptional regulator with XRE-family HTH domain